MNQGRRQRRSIWPVILLAGLLAFWAAWNYAGRTLPSGTSGDIETVEFTGPTMGTTYTVKVAARSSELSAERRESAASTITGVLNDINQLMSTYLPDSELSKFNQHAELTPFNVSHDTLTVFLYAQGISEESEGAFDVTIGPLVNLWGFGPVKREGIPTEDEIAAAKARVGYRMLEIDPANNSVRKQRPDMYCDFSAIAQGYAADKVAAALDTMGFSNYMIDISGEIRAKGHNDRGEPWKIGVETPSPEGRSVQLVVPLEDISIATSGDYRNFFEKDGKRFSHEIDPSTGRPIEHKLASVSVLTEECALADGYATALLVLGPEKGMQLAERMGLPVYFLIHDDAGGFIEKQSTAFTELLEVRSTKSEVRNRDSEF